MATTLVIIEHGDSHSHVQIVGPLDLAGVGAIELKFTASTASKRRHAICLLYTSPSPRDRQKSRMPSSA